MSDVEHPPDWWDILDMLEQGEWWRARDEGWLRVSEMGESHKRNLAAWLKRREAVLSRAMYERLTHGLDGEKHWHDEIIDGAVDETCALDWLETRPLYKALTA